MLTERELAERAAELMDWPDAEGTKAMLPIVRAAIHTGRAMEARCAREVFVEMGIRGAAHNIQKIIDREEAAALKALEGET